MPASSPRATARRGDVRAPRGLLDHGPAVVRAELGLGHHLLLAAGPLRRRRSSTARPGTRPRTAAARPAAAARRAATSGQVARGHHRVRRQAVDLGLVEQQEERAVAADAVVRVRRRTAAPRPRPSSCSSATRARPARAARRAARTGSTRSGRPWRRPASGRRRAGRSTACTCTRRRRPRAVSITPYGQAGTQ